MALYGEAGVSAWRLLSEARAKTPQEAWNEAIKTKTESSSSQKKLCPRFTFLGLCEAGLLKGISAADYVGAQGTNSLYIPNKQRAIHAVQKLREDMSLADDRKKLWSIIGNGEHHNGQMDVVLALWKHDLIDAPPR